MEVSQEEVIRSNEESKARVLKMTSETIDLKTSADIALEGKKVACAGFSLLETGWKIWQAALCLQEAELVVLNQNKPNLSTFDHFEANVLSSQVEKSEIQSRQEGAEKTELSSEIIERGFESFSYCPKSWQFLFFLFRRRKEESVLGTQFRRSFPE